MSDNPIRYEINHNCEIVEGQAALSNNLDILISELFSQFGWSYTEISKQSAYRKVKLTSPDKNEFILDLFAARIRNEKRNPYEKKIQLSKEDPRLYRNNITLILGFYVFEENDSINDAIIVGYPVDNRIKYETNPSLRGTFINDILYKAKINGICIDEARKMIGFRPEFIFYYLNEYKRVHGYDNNEFKSISLKVMCDHKKDYIGKPLNRIIFGAPGTGKSHKLQMDSKLFGDNFERVTFHSNYSYVQFVGTYKPIQGDNSSDITYEYVPGPFMRVYVQAINHPDENFLLLIEEINRANAAAVFGDIFQLLDRKNGISEYPVATTEDIKKYFKKNLKCLREKDINGNECPKSFDKFSASDMEKYRYMSIPDNMYIWATMNSADQGVFPMDTAFKRRWEFEYLSVNDDEQVAAIKDYVIPMCFKDNKADHYIGWDSLRTRINNILTSEKCKVNEDKLLGPFFISKNMLDEIKNNKEQIDELEAKDEASRTDKDNEALKDMHQKEKNYIKAFESKVIMYLFEDVMKMRPENIFIGHHKKNGKMIFSEICKAFEQDGEGIFGIEELENI